jgi:hypothetical protein
MLGSSIFQKWPENWLTPLMNIEGLNIMIGEMTQRLGFLMSFESMFRLL